MFGEIGEIDLFSNKCKIRKTNLLRDKAYVW